MRLIDADALSKKLNQTTIIIKDGEVFQRMINDAPTVDAVEVVRCKGWIPVSERLPEAPTFCLVTTDGSYNDVIDIALYMSDGWHKASKVLAWMPLPEPWKDGEA